MLAIGIAILVYVILVYFLGIPEVQRTFELVRQRARQKAEKEPGGHE